MATAFWHIFLYFKQTQLICRFLPILLNGCFVYQGMTKLAIFTIIFTIFHNTQRLPINVSLFNYHGHSAQLTNSF